MRFTVGEEKAMRRAMALAEGVRGTTSPNPWVGAVVVPGRFEGATSPPGGPHAEAVALAAAGMRARGATLVCTLEPCSHHGRTPPCTDAILAAGVRRVVVGVEDPDPRVKGSGLDRLREAGLDVVVGVCADEVRAQLAPYLKHRETGRPYVVLKLAVTMDGRTAAADGTSRWITGEAARADAHRLRADCDAVVVGAGTVRADDPELTVRAVDTPRQPLRVVLGKAGADAKVQPAVELFGEPREVLEELGRLGVLSAVVEGGATVAGAFHRAGVVDRYVLYLAPAILGGDDGRPVLAGPGAATMAAVWRGRIVAVRQLGDDLRIDLVPLPA
ncbi:MAG: bifunctional diaminohydroxyphosphoribosylaminopyrimidine deaminase/5-amino-6-(5-phosphoribosylamino)uracil reductase RibD [Acidimicrobiia bacterium]